jgi:hypothetical protein
LEEKRTELKTAGLAKEARQSNAVRVTSGEDMVILKKGKT